jgi:hypothetical integral membrane protein (TIGR02206 family)
MMPTLAGAETCFIPGSAWHAAMVIGGSLTLFGFVVAGRLQTTPQGERTVARVLAWISTGIVAASWVYWLIIRDTDIKSDLPLQACDWAGVIAPLALLTRWRVMRAACFYWALAFTIQAFVTPTIRSGPHTLEFWIFWLSHLAILACGTYDFWVRGFRPGWRDLRLGLLVCYVWLAVVIPFNLIFDANYGFLGNTKPDAPTLVDVLGPWPGRMFIMLGIGHAAFVALTLIFGAVPGGEPRRTSARTH